MTLQTKLRKELKCREFIVEISWDHIKWSAGLKGIMGCWKAHTQTLYSSTKMKTKCIKWYISQPHVSSGWYCKVLKTSHKHAYNMCYTKMVNYIKW